MHKVLEDIVSKKRQDLVQAKQAVSLDQLQQQNTAYKSTFYDAFARASGTALIAEIKLASPTHAALGDSSKVAERARLYEAAGATALSFITERHYFKSDTTYVPLLKETVSLPVLQKDFVVDAYQIYEARSIGSDALLLIARLVDDATLRHFVTLAQSLGVEPVVEVDTAADLERALGTTTRCIAVNARDLSTFTVDVDAACQLIARIPDAYLRLGFSGIVTVDDVHAYRDQGADAVLVGTSLMQASDATQKIQELRS